MMSQTLTTYTSLVHDVTDTDCEIEKAAFMAMAIDIDRLCFQAAEVPTTKDLLCVFVVVLVLWTCGKKTADLQSSQKVYGHFFSIDHRSLQSTTLSKYSIVSCALQNRHLEMTLLHI